MVYWDYKGATIEVLDEKISMIQRDVLFFLRSEYKRRILSLYRFNERTFYLTQAQLGTFLSTYQSIEKKELHPVQANFSK